MGIEIERKFLIKRGAVLPEPEKILSIRQGYLRKGSGMSVRIRICNDKGYLTIKGPKEGSSLSRMEYEYEIPIGDAHELLSLCREGIIVKQRLLINVEGVTWEVDRFEGENAGLLLAEVELANESVDVPIPVWVGEEVTGQPEYYNSYLSQMPYKTWNKPKE